MPIIGSNFLEMHFTRSEVNPKGSVTGKLNRSFNIIDVTERQLPVRSYGKALVFKFRFNVEYTIEGSKQKFGEINIIGEVLYTTDDRTTKKILKDWKKNKKVDMSILGEVINAGLHMAQLEALYNAQKVMLPPPVQLPMFRPNQSSREYIG